MLSQKEIREGEKMFAVKVAALRLETQQDQVFTDSAFTVIEFDKLITQGDSVKGDISINAIGVQSAGIYEVSFGFNAEFNTGDEIALIVVVNGVEYSTTPNVIQGRGNGRPVSTYWKSVVNLEAGAIIQIAGKNFDAGNLTAKIKRLHFAVKKDF